MRYRVHCSNNKHQAGSMRSNAVAIIATTAPIVEHVTVFQILDESGVLRGENVEAWIRWLLNNGYLELM